MLAAITRRALVVLILAGCLGCQSAESLRIAIAEAASRTEYVLRSQSNRESGDWKVDDSRFAKVFQSEPSESPKSPRQAISRLAATVNA